MVLIEENNFRLQQTDMWYSLSVLSSRDRREWIEFAIARPEYFQHKFYYRIYLVDYSYVVPERDNPLIYYDEVETRFEAVRVLTEIQDKLLNNFHYSTSERRWFNHYESKRVTQITG